MTVGEGSISINDANFSRCLCATAFLLRESIDDTVPAIPGGGALNVLAGVETTDGITIDNKVLTLTAANLGSKDIAVTGEYTLALDAAVQSSSDTAAHLHRRALDISGQL